MPELPEVETVVRELHRKLSGKTITKVTVRLGKMVALGPKSLPPKRKQNEKAVKKFIHLLKGRKILSVTRRAKLIIIDLSGPLSLLVHLKMTGQFIYFRKSELDRKVRIINKSGAPLHAMPCPYTHVIFDFSDGSRLFYNDVRQFGYMKLVTDKEIPQVRELSEFGPEPLAKEFTFDAFRKILEQRPNQPIKQLLLDPKLIAGIGNIYSDEILFRSHIRPERKAKNLNDAEQQALYKAIPVILKKGIAAKGSSVGDFIRTDGSFGSMGKHHFVYQRDGQLCKNCDTIIKSNKFGGRTASYCPSCQK